MVAGYRQFGAAEREAQFDQATVLDRFPGSRWNAKRALEHTGVDIDAGSFRCVHHIKRNNDGPEEIESLMK